MSHSLGMFLILVLILAQLGLLGFNILTYHLRSFGNFYAQLPDGQTVKITPLLRPSTSIAALLNWTTIAATATFNIDFVNYEKNLSDVKQYFTSGGYDAFLAALNKDQVLATILSKKLVVSAVAIGPAIILREEVLIGDIYSWTIQVPLTVSYLSASAEEKANKLVTLTVSQVSTELSPTGIGIERYEAADISPEILRELI